MPAAQGAHEPRGDARGKKRGMVDGMRDFQQQIDVTATRGIVEPRAEKTDDAVGTGFFAGDAANHVHLFCCQAHGRVLRCTQWRQCSTAPRNRNYPKSHPGRRVIGADFLGQALAQPPLPFRPDLILPVPAWRSVVKAKFPVRSGRGALLKIQLDDGEVAPAGAIVHIEGDNQEFYVARRGEAFVTGLQPNNRVVLKWKERQCSFDVALPPESGDEVPRLGPLLCKGIPR